MTRRKKKGFNPKVSDLRTVVGRGIVLLTQDQKKELAKWSLKAAKKHCKKLDKDDPSKWVIYVGKERLKYSIKELLNIKASRPVNDYRAGPLTLDNLRELADHIGIKRSELGDINRSVWWSQIVAKAKRDEDSKMNRLLKLWGWFEERIDDSDIKYLMDNAPGYWQDSECYKDLDWRVKHLSDIFEISFIIQEVVDAKLKSEERRSSVSGLSSVQLWEIATKIMNLESQLPKIPTKKILWEKILEKIEQDKISKTQ